MSKNTVYLFFEEPIESGVQTSDSQKSKIKKKKKKQTKKRQNQKPTFNFSELEYISKSLWLIQI